MALMTAGDTLKVVVLGNDGIMRGMLVNRNAKMAANKYIITQKDVFLQRSKKYNFFEYDQPTIMFRENSAHAIPKEGQESFPTPVEMADTIENAAMHLFTLFGEPKSNIWLIMILIAACVAAGCAGGALYFGYTNENSMKSLKAEVTNIETFIGNSTYGAGSGIVTTDTVPGGIVTPKTTTPVPIPSGRVTL
jgi:hypothetical protein